MKILRRKASGITLVETMVCLGLAAIIGTVAVTFFRESTMLSQSASVSQDVLATRSGALQFILEDLRSAKRSSIGNLILNGDFENTKTGSTPAYWSDDVVVIATGATASASLNTNDLANEVYSGFSSLKLTSTGDSDYYYGSTITLTPGNAYLITAWVRSDNAAMRPYLALANTLGAKLVETWGLGTTWQAIKLRYPANGTYTSGTLINNQARLILGAYSANGNTFFDNVTFVSFNSVLSSSNTASINTSQTINNLSDPQDNCGIRFIKVDHSTNVLYRYRIGIAKGESAILREYFDEGTHVWTKKIPSEFALGLTDFSLGLNQPTAGATLPSNGTDAPILVYLKSNSITSKKFNPGGVTEQFYIYPQSL